MPAFARDVFNVGPQGLGWMLTVPALGTIATGITLAWVRRVALVRSFVILVAAMACALIGFCATRSFPVALGLLFVIGGCSTAANTLANTLLQENVEERLRGRMMSLFMASPWAWLLRPGARPSPSASPRSSCWRLWCPLPAAARYARPNEFLSLRSGRGWVRGSASSSPTAVGEAR
jgi:hypothetical protein